MKFIFFISTIIFSYEVFSNNLFETKEYSLKFSSENINLVKEKKINDIKIKSLKSVLFNILNSNDYIKTSSNIDIYFVNNFIKNLTINEEKIINNNYFSKVKINFSKKKIINYLINNKINYVDSHHDKFLILIFEEMGLQKNFLTKKNNFYKYLISSNNEIINKYFVIPNLDYNDRYILNSINFDKDSIVISDKLNNKYDTIYQIAIHSELENNLYYIKTYLLEKDKKYLIDSRIVKTINYDKFLIEIYTKYVDKWKELNQIDISITTSLFCKVETSNIKELKFIRNSLKSEMIIKNIDLTSIMFNENIYNILYYGSFKFFKKSLLNVRLSLNMKNNECYITLI